MELLGDRGGETYLDTETYAGLTPTRADRKGKFAGRASRNFSSEPMGKRAKKGQYTNGPAPPPFTDADSCLTPAPRSTLLMSFLWEGSWWRLKRTRR